MAGLGITAIYSYSGDTAAIVNAKTRASNICDNYPLDKQLELIKDPAIINRGMGFVASFIPSTHIDNTLYAQALNIGSRVIQKDYNNSTMMNQLAGLWPVRDLIVESAAKNN